MPFIKHYDFERLVLAGGVMSNICFNQKQLVASTDPSLATALGNWQKDWDTALLEIRTNLKAKKDKS